MPVTHTIVLTVSFMIGWACVAQAQSPAWYPLNIDPPEAGLHEQLLPVSSRQAKPHGPVVVQDVRVQSNAETTRLVFDLQRQVQVQQRREHHPDRLILELQNARLSTQATHRLAGQAMPASVSVRQITPNGHSKARAVWVTLTDVADYKISPLSKPPRLVVDVVVRKDQGDPASAAPPPSKLPATPADAPTPAKPPAGRNGVKLIVIDPGHGGRDPGAVGHGGLEEKRITLRVGLLLRDLIAQQLKKPALMTRDRDVFVELDDRAKIANSKDADLFVSIHVNSHPQRSTKGLEIYHFGEASDRRALEVAARENGTPISETGVGWQLLVADLLTTKKIQDSLELAWHTKEAVVNRLKEGYDVDDHGVKTAPFYVLRFTSMPSILAEIAFISNPGEEKLMQTDAFLTRIAEGILEGIRSYLNPPVQTAK